MADLYYGHCESQYTYTRECATITVMRSDWSKVLLRLGIIFSPFFVALIAERLASFGNNNIFLGPALIVGVFIITILGTTTSFVSRHKPNHEQITLIGYAVPALVFNFWLLLVG